MSRPALCKGLLVQGRQLLGRWPSMGMGMLLLAGWGLPAHAQYGILYRPPTADYHVLHSPHFDVIYQQGLAAEAQETAALLEANLPATRALIGTRSRMQMPVVLNRFNDRSNGYVTPFPFKQEIEAVRIKGEALTAYYATWLQFVVPHELTHAVQAEYDPGFGVGRVLRWFAPDLSRGLNLGVPSGITEGLAVFRESQINPRAGRLNVPLYQMEFRAAMGSPHPWSLSQVFEPPRFTYPFDRYYNGGGHFVRYLIAHHGARALQRANAFYYRFPFMGYGLALWYGTGYLPVTLGRRFRAEARRQEAARQDSLAPFTPLRRIASARGLRHHRPHWLDDQTLLAYVAGYNVRPGFYMIDAASGRRTLVGHHAPTEDRYFSLSHEGGTLYYARYVPDPLVPLQALAEVFRVDIATGATEQLTRKGRVLAPVEAPDGRLWALQNEGQFNRWVVLDETGKPRVYRPASRTTFKQLLPAPDGSAVAVLLNQEGRQGVYRAVLKDGAPPELAPWVVFEGAYVYDASWSADGRYLLFSSDRSGIANVYALDVAADRIVQLTYVPFGAVEPTLSPDGTTLAFVNYVHERYDLVRIPFRPEDGRVVPQARSYRLFDLHPTPPALPPAVSDTGAARPYRAGRYLKPRALYPALYLNDEATSDSDPIPAIGLGLALQGADPLQQWGYGATIFYQTRRIWGGATLQTGRHFLRPALSVFDLPRYVNVAGLPGRTLLGERGVAIGLTTPIALRENVFQTRANLGLNATLRALRPVETEALATSTRFTLSPIASFAHRVQMNPRDLMPNAGLVLAARAEADVLARGAHPGQVLIARLYAYLPWLHRYNHGLRLDAGLLTQNRGALLTLDTFVPRGYEDEGLEAGTFVRYGLTYLLPLRYVDHGLVLLPVSLQALFAYGFAETLHPLDDWSGLQHTAGIGGGVGARLRLFFHLDLEIRVGAVYKLGERAWAPIFR